MPANLTSEYFKAEQRFHTATANEEKIHAFERMLAVMPKHKETYYLKSGLRSKLVQFLKNQVNISALSFRTHSAALRAGFDSETRHCVFPGFPLPAYAGTSLPLRKQGRE